MEAVVGIAVVVTAVAAVADMVQVVVVVAAVAAMVVVAEEAVVAVAVLDSAAMTWTSTLASQCHTSQRFSSCEQRVRGRCRVHQAHP